MADHLAVLNMPMQALQRSATVSSFDPLCGGPRHGDTSDLSEAQIGDLVQFLETL